MSEKRADDGANFCGPLRISELEGRRKGGLSYSQCARGTRLITAGFVETAVHKTALSYRLHIGVCQLIFYKFLNCLS